MGWGDMLCDGMGGWLGIVGWVVVMSKKGYSWFLGVACLVDGHGMGSLEVFEHYIRINVRVKNVILSIQEPEAIIHLIGKSQFVTSHFIIQQ